MLGNILKNLREQLGWSQQQLADKAKVSLPTIYKTEKDGRPSKKVLTRLLNALCLNIDDVLKDSQLTSEDILFLENKKTERLFYR
jgi:transcriptional regulator with XRE-family HTH domain